MLQVYSLKLTLKIKTNSERTKFIFEPCGTLKIYLTSLPVNGKANKELINVLSKKLKILKSNVIILRGERSSTKIILLQNIPFDEDAIRLKLALSEAL